MASPLTVADQLLIKTLQIKKTGLLTKWLSSFHLDSVFFNLGHSSAYDVFIVSRLRTLTIFHKATAPPFLGWRGGFVVERRTCDLVVAGSRPGRDAAA